MSLYTRDGIAYTEVGHDMDGHAVCLMDKDGIRCFANDSDIPNRPQVWIDSDGLMCVGGDIVLDDILTEAAATYRNCRSCGQMYPLDGFVGGCPSCGAPMEAR